MNLNCKKIKKIKKTFGALYAYNNLNKESKEPEWTKLENALKDKNITNIAISAPYDTGKSSFMLSFFNKLEESPTHRFLRLLGLRNKSYRFISVPNFFEDINDKKKGEIELEKDILDQLLLGSKPSRLRFPDSSIKRIYPISFFTVLISYFMIVLLIGIIFSKKLILNSNTLLNIIGLIIIGFFGFIIYYYLLHFLNKISLSLSTKFSISNTTIESNLTPGNEVAERDKFVEYNEELRYYFEKSGERFIVFEDLDRYNNPLIFQRLRALNLRLNNTFTKSPIVFIYTLKDSTFSKKIDDTSFYNENYAAEMRAKFFDYIISIFPLHSLENSYDVFIKQRDKCKRLLIDDKYCYGIGKYIHDRRQIITIISDVDTYAQKLKIYKIEFEDEKDKREACNKLFGLIVYKNVYPDDFDKLITGQAFLSQLIADKQDIYRVIKQLCKIKKEKFPTNTWINIFQYLNKDNFNSFSFSDKVNRDLKKLFKHPILLYLISNGLLSEDYYNYLSPTYFSLKSPKDKMFINKVLNHQVIKKSETLEYPSEVLNYFRQINIDYRCAYSVELLREMVKNDPGAYLKEIEVMIHQIERNKDFEFVNRLFLKETAKENLEYILKYWGNFLDDLLATTNKSRFNIIDSILRIWIKNQENFDRITKFLTSNVAFLEANEVQSSIVSQNYRSSFANLVQKSIENYQFKNITFLVDYPDLMKTIVRENWYRKNYINFEIIITNLEEIFTLEKVINFVSTKYFEKNIKNYLTKNIIAGEELEQLIKYVDLMPNIYLRSICYSKLRSNYIDKDKRLKKHLDNKINGIKELKFYNWIMNFKKTSGWLNELAKIIYSDRKVTKNIRNLESLDIYMYVYGKDKKVELALKKAWKMYEERLQL